MFKSIGTNIEGHSGVEITYTSEESLQLLRERRFENLEQCAFLLSFLNISPESEEWRVVANILSDINIPDDISDDFLFEEKLELCTVPVTIDFTKTHADEALHCDAANIHFEKSALTLEEMLLQQNLRVYFYIQTANGVLAAQIMLYGIITLMPLHPIISTNNAVLLPTVLYPLKLTGDVAKEIHRFAMQRFIYDHKEELARIIEREITDIYNGSKSKPEFTNAFEKMIGDYLWTSSLRSPLASLVRRLNTWILNNSGSRDAVEEKIQIDLNEIVSKLDNFKEPEYHPNFDSLLLKPGRMVRSDSRYTQDLSPAI